MDPIAFSSEPQSEDSGYDVVLDPEPSPVVPPPEPPANGAAPITAAAPNPTATVPNPVPAAAPVAVPSHGGFLTRFRQAWSAAAPKQLEPVAANTAGAKPAEARGPRLRVQRKPTRSLYITVPAWAASVFVHVGVLTALGLASLSTEIRQAIAPIDAAMIDTSLAKQQAEELLHIDADPSNTPRELAAGLLEANTPGLGGGLGTGSGPPTATPRVVQTRAAGERNSLPSSVSVGAALTPLAIKPPSAILTKQLGGGIGGLVAGDSGRETSGIGEALDQIAREILHMLERGRVTVVWMFDESGSMRDDQLAIKDKFGRIAAELRKHIPEDKKSQNAMTHAVVGFGEQIHFNIDKPTADLGDVSKAIEKLRTDETGVENTNQALLLVANRYAKLSTKDHRVMIVLATDESGDDGLEYLEAARTATTRANMPIYVIGRQAVFGKTDVVLPFVDPLTGDRYYPAIRRGPESPDFECLQWDGMHPRWDEQPSGFAPYELARLSKATGGIYFLLPSEEGLRAASRRREKAYSMATLKEYTPDYEGRALYNQRILKSPFRRTLVEVINQTKGFGYRHHYPIEPPELLKAISEELPKVQTQLAALVKIEPILKSLAKDREHEPEKRWQAHYDLMLAQIVAYKIQAYEYRACLQEMAVKVQAGKLQPKTRPKPGQLIVMWQIDHSPDYRAPKQDTEKVRDEATVLLKKVIERHPNSPWADLAQDEINRGFGCRLNEWSQSPKYNERAKLVPKY